MKVFITGATGFIGRNLALKLAEGGHEINALYRDPGRTEGMKHEKITWFRGDLSDKDSICIAMKDCEQVYHIAAFVSLSIRNPGMIYQQNVQGTVNVLDCASDLGIKKMVFTSTAGVFGPKPGEILDETAPYPEEMFTDYIRSKAEAEKVVLEYVGKGMDIVTVNPTRVFGPGLLSTSNAAGIMDQYLKGKWRIMPGKGEMTGNYVFVDDVSRGIMLAMQKGRKGERYILGGENLSFMKFIETIKRTTGKNRILIRVPGFVILLIAHVLLFAGRLLGRTPPFTPDEVKRLNNDWLVSSAKATRELEYKPRSFEEGVKTTIAWLNSKSTH